MFTKKKVESPAVEKKVEKPTPAYLGEDYPYKAVGDVITDLDSLEQHGVLYEIKCPKCEMCIRSQGCNVKRIYEKLLNGVEIKNEDGSSRIEGGKGCIGCGNRELVVRKVDMSKMAEVKKAREEKMAAQERD